MPVNAACAIKIYVIRSCMTASLKSFFSCSRRNIKSVLEQDLLYDEEGQSCTSHTFFHHLFQKTRSFPFYSAKEYIDFRRKTLLIPMIFTGWLMPSCWSWAKAVPEGIIWWGDISAVSLPCWGDEALPDPDPPDKNLQGRKAFLPGVPAAAEQKGQDQPGRTGSGIELTATISTVWSRSTPAGLCLITADPFCWRRLRIFWKIRTNGWEICEELGYTNWSHLTAVHWTFRDDTHGVPGIGTGCK